MNNFLYTMATVISIYCNEGPTGTSEYSRDSICRDGTPAHTLMISFMTGSGHSDTLDHIDTLFEIDIDDRIYYLVHPNVLTAAQLNKLKFLVKP